MARVQFFSLGNSLQSITFRDAPGMMHLLFDSARNTP